MKNIKTNIFFAALVAILFGCSSDDNKDYNTRKATDAKATVNLSFDENAIFNEGTTSVITYSIDLDQPQIADIVVKISLVDGTATAGEDFTFDTTVTIPANKSQAVGTISLVSDLDFEEMETFTLKIGEDNTANVDLEPRYVTVKIGNYQEDDLNIVLNWEGSFEGIDGPTDFCDIDMDLELINADGDYISTSYSNCPESITMPASMANGVYSLVISLWTNYGETAVIDVPAAVSIFKIGTLTSTNQDISAFFPLAAGGLDDGNNSAFIVYTIVKNGTTFTVTNQANAQILQGRSQAQYASILKKIQDKNKK
jgi:hypothetical protein